MGFLRDLVQIVAYPVQFPHKIKIGGRGRVLRDDAVYQVAQIRFAGNPAFLDLLV